METIIGIFLITRFFFLAEFPHFYDSPEYLRLAQEKNLITALQKSHESIHPVYLFLIQAANKLYRFMNLITFVSFVSAFFGLLSFIVFYLLIKRLFDKRTAFFSLIPLIFFPHLWLIQTNIMHEAVDHFFLLSSFLVLDILLTSKRFVYLLICLLFYLLALINFPGNFIWSPIFFGLFVYRKYKK